MVLKVSNQSNPNSVAGMIANLLKDGKTNLEVNCIGAGSVNQAIKAIVIARGFVAPLGMNLKCIPAFFTVRIEEQDRTGIKLILEV